ncbi:serine/threonine-protein kinase [Hyalangium sp.]|uniref:serine/threonine-protein kinase n=1 Tax=Hyalangium sp. TaxID=2028555 RepID=UPI002D4D522C|nr:protein kinase [Hyalangium sp.]HYI02299.1 protein kinase [Hyalangium sp.]
MASRGGTRPTVSDTPSPPPLNPSLPVESLVLTPGTRIHQYELIRQLGAGGMGTVFLARDTRLGRRVAIKFLHTQDPQITRRFILEAHTTARCSHENIVVIYEAGEFQGSPFMVLEYLQGQPLHKAVGSQRLPPQRAVELMVPVVKALASAHAEGIVHRDLKPENILVTDTGTLKVLDFGIAKVLQGPGRSSEPAHGGLPPASGLEEGELSNITRTGMVVGTLPYMSPEQWRGGEQVDHRTDLWAVGIMLFRLLAGRHPLDPLRGPQLVITAELSEPMPRLREVAPDVPAELANVVDRCLLKAKDQRWQDALSLLRALEPFLPGRYTRELQLDESPYAGLSSFQESDASRFFGRSREIAALVGRLRDRPLLAVVGPSGTGKSSFVRAGLVPALKRSGEAWETLIVRPGRHPLAALAHTIAPLVSSSTSLAEDLQEHQKLVERLRTEPGLVGSVLRSRARRHRQRILLLVDQFEELYTLVPDAQERRAFTACLSGIADDATSPTRVVLSLRSDFLDRVPEDERFMAELSQGLFFLTTPGREGLRDALVQPAEMAGYHFETPALVEDMLRHLESTPGALPLLQFAATQLWEQRDPARKLLTQQSYEAMGGIAGALASHADSVLSGLSPQGHALARAILLRLVTPERTRAIVSLEELGEQSRDRGELQQVTDQLVQARLLLVQTGGGATGGTVELVHESLIHGWPTLRRWLDESQEDSAFLEQLRNAARQWQAKGRDSGLLWRGEMVEEARRFQRRHSGELPQVQQDFLAAIFAQELRTHRRKRGLVVGAMVSLSLLVAASAVALVVIRKAQREAEVRAVEAQQAERRARESEEVARNSAEAARQAEAETKRHLKEVQDKERQRLVAQRKAEEATRQAEEKNQELKRSLRKEKYARGAARVAMKRARHNEELANRKTQEIQQLLDKEKKRLEQIGITPLMKELKKGAHR